TVGMSGNAGDRVEVVTASARSLPVRTYSIEDGRLSNINCTCPLITSTSAGADPRYGTWTRLTPVFSLNNSPVRWTFVPLPADAKLSLPGLALAYAMNSGTVVAGTEGFTAITLAARTMPATGAIS